MPSKNNKSYIRLTSRDLTIFDYLLERKVATIYQIKNHLNLSSQRNHLNSRLHQLFQNHYLNSFWTAKGQKAFCLGKESIQLLHKTDKIAQNYPEAFLGWNKYQDEHDLLLNEVYQALRSIEIVKDLKTHNLLLAKVENWTKSFNLPDATFNFTTAIDDRYWALELELNLKSQDRYTKIFRHYYYNDDIAGVLYLVEKDSDVSQLKKIDKKFKLGKESKIFIAKVSNFLKDPIQTKFLSSDEKSFSFHRKLSQKKEFFNKNQIGQ